MNDVWILRDISFEVSEGEILGLLSENDSESSAVLELSAEPKNLDEERISFNGNALSEKDVTIFPPPAEKNLWQKFFSQKSIANSSEKFKEVFEDALNKAEKILLLDNPFVCLHENLRDELLETLRKIVRQKNLTAILKTNDDNEIFAVCDKAAVLHKGEIAQVGTPRELYEKPKSIAVASALGRHNFIKAMRVSFTNQSSQEFQTLKGEHRLQTDKSEKSVLGAINSPVTLAIRPEHISISFGASFPEDNLLKAKISDVQYCGATTRIMLDANGLILEALVLRLVGLKVGDECMVGLPPDRIQVLKD